MKTTKSYTIENLIVKPNIKVLVENDDGITEEVTDFLRERFLASNRFITKQKASNDVTVIYQYYPEKKNINEEFINSLLKLLINYPSARFEVEEKSNVTYLKISVNIENAYTNERNGIQNYNYAKTYLNELLISHEEEVDTKVNVSTDYSSMRPLDRGRAEKYFDKYRFDGYTVYEAIEKGKINKLIIDHSADSMIDFNRTYYNRMNDPDKQAKYIEKLSATKTSFELVSNKDFYYTIPSYGAEYLILTYPDLVVEEK